MDEVERRLEIHRQHGVPLGLGHAHHQTVLRDSGVVHQDVNAAELLDDLLDDLVGLFEIGGIRGVTLGLDAECGNLGLGGLSVLIDGQIGEGDVGTLLGELQRDGLADTAGGTRYDGNFSFE